MQPRVENDKKLQSEENKQGRVGYERVWSFSRGTAKVGTESILDACPNAHTSEHMWSLS